MSAKIEKASFSGEGPPSVIRHLWHLRYWLKRMKDGLATPKYATILEDMERVDDESKIKLPRKIDLSGEHFPASIISIHQYDTKIHKWTNGLFDTSIIVYLIPLERYDATQVKIDDISSTPSTRRKKKEAEEDVPSLPSSLDGPISKATTRSSSTASTKKRSKGKTLSASTASQSSSSAQNPSSSQQSSSLQSTAPSSPSSSSSQSAPSLNQSENASTPSLNASLPFGGALENLLSLIDRFPVPSRHSRDHKTKPLVLLFTGLDIFEEKLERVPFLQFFPSAAESIDDPTNSRLVWPWIENHFRTSLRARLSDLEIIARPINLCDLTHFPVLWSGITQDIANLQQGIEIL